MKDKFSAAPQMLGYLYQARYALYLILDAPDESELSIERVDDVAFGKSDNPEELLQLKHHINTKTSLTNSSTDLWKTINVWSTKINKGEINPSNVILTLITTANAPDSSIAALLRPGAEREPELAHENLAHIASTSENASLKDAFNSFLALSNEQRKMLVKSIQILDKSPKIQETSEKIKEKIRFAVRREHLTGLYERLEGWWFNKVIQHLTGNSTELITGFEVHNHISDVAEQFKPNALPIDFLDALPDTIDPESDERMFVQQLKIISLHNKRIEKAIIDYYRAVEQRSKWAREDLLIGDEVQKYEKRLVDEWERYTLSCKDECQIDEENEKGMQEFGRKVYNWMDLKANIRIRSEVSEPYVMRGSYHILANDSQVWWHPKFIERLQDLLRIPHEV